MILERVFDWGPDVTPSQRARVVEVLRKEEQRILSERAKKKRKGDEDEEYSTCQRLVSWICCFGLVFGLVVAVKRSNFSQASLEIAVGVALLICIRLKFQDSWWYKLLCCFLDCLP